MKVYAKEAQGIQNSIKLMLLHPGVSISNDTQTQKDKHSVFGATTLNSSQVLSIAECLPCAVNMSDILILRFNCPAARLVASLPARQLKTSHFLSMGGMQPLDWLKS